MHSATPPGMITTLSPPRNIFNILDLEIGSNPNHVHKCRTNGTLKMAALAKHLDRRVVSVNRFLFASSGSS